jgi:DNA processing protein
LSAAATAPNDEIDLAQWIRLTHTPGIGAITARNLLAGFGMPATVFSASAAALAAVVGVTIARELTRPVSSGLHNLIACTLDWCRQPGNHVLTLADPRYPPALLTIPDPPILLYAKGRIELLRHRCVGVVGSRNATAQGITNAETFAEALSHAGLTVVSGMALGIDAAAHAGALRHASSGATIAVIGTGQDIVYPARNRALAHRIANEGCIVSEYALGTPAVAANFPRRNRLISGLACGVLVVEAAEKSGSLITARVAADQGRDVFAIPGSIHSPLSKGCHVLIKQGAKLVESAQDILEEISVIARNTPSASMAVAVAQPCHSALYDQLGFDPVDGDTLAARSGLDAAALATQLLELELQGLLEVLPGGAYRRLG